MTTATKERKKRTTTGQVLSANSLAKALAIVAPAVGGRSPKPILQNVLLAGGTLSATDLELRITTPLQAYDGPPLLLPHARLAAIVGSLHPTAEVTLQADNTACIVRGGNGSWRIPVEDPQEYPVAAEPKAKPIARLPADQFVSLMQSVKFATDNESSRYALGGVRVEWSKGILSFVGTDGRRMCVAECEVDQATDDAAVTAPRRAVDVLCRLARQGEEVQLSQADAELVGTVDQTVVQARLVDGRYPNWREVEPTRTVTPTLVVLGSLLHACRQAAICTSEQSKGVDFVFTAEGLHLSSRSSEHGEASATCEVVQAGKDCQVKLDPAFVTEWLGCGSFDAAETIEVEAENHQAAVVLRAQDCRCIIMPLAKD